MIVVLGLFGASLFFGDGVITPAISVLVGGRGPRSCRAAARALHRAAGGGDHRRPVRFQSRGTGRVGAVFGRSCCSGSPVLACSALITSAGNPQRAGARCRRTTRSSFSRTNAGSRSSRSAPSCSASPAPRRSTRTWAISARSRSASSWFGLVLPALVLNYFGQGALLLADPAAAKNPFYMMVPPALLIPMIVLATAAAVIASQAVISGAFSVTREAIQLGYLPRMEVAHVARDARADLSAVDQPHAARADARGRGRLPLVRQPRRRVRHRGRRHDDDRFDPRHDRVPPAVALEQAACRRGRRHCSCSSTAAFLSANADKVEHGGWFPLVLGSVSSR